MGNQVKTPPQADKHLLQIDRRHVWHPFTKVGAKDPIVIESGEGAVLRTDEGREILDCISSWWVNLYGHGHPHVANAIHAQALKLEQVIFAGFTHEPAALLSEQLADVLPGDLNRVFFSDNGSTSVEVALKMAAQFWQNQGQQRTRVMVFDGGYHGDTVGAMSVGVSSGFFDVWKKWLIDVDVMPFPETWAADPELEAKEAKALQRVDEFLEQHAEEIVAMIMEPLIQGASGMRMCRPEFLRALVERLRNHEIIVIFDEVMTGFGRTGQRFACQTADITPDIICLSKGLTGGFMPMSVTVASDRIYDAFETNDASSMFCHGHSYTANPLGCAAALASLDLLKSSETDHNWRRIEAAHRKGLQRLSEFPLATRQRIRGTIAAVNVAVDDTGYQSHVADQLKSFFWNPEGDRDSFLIRPLGNVIYLMPPYCMTDEQLDRAWQAIFEAFQLLAK
ncbi:MAG: adenosylmethionine--8-amino-7-oxononanoate transaminase [Planctomycetaceae bacterium]|nr:adenosylmethionine--8-amino-7-oxononanoate transaminase [Planctomycetaceae bacterium]MCP4463902.1 adenosylmethionine--8-amino-7-oxononanoate transaminase [Planctomycetaceae bacterium]MDG1809086.1 adenosylmethionine--8-amino-7-oxononanoate transaminase [Pirellulaceae bacterium]MDG2103297.1 adenosylmethionine--8-amino-7-oxononanoate transaminase [Pirellulaceae bacterium]